MKYIKGEERYATCFLCDAASGPPEKDEENLVVARGDHAFVILNLYPYNTGHLMIAPHRHVADIDDLEHAEFDEIWSWLSKTIAAHREASQPEGFNIGINLGVAAGAGVPGHFHLHVVPRWGGDTNFMPVIGQTRVLPELLAETYARIAPAFAQSAGL